MELNANFSLSQSKTSEHQSTVQIGFRIMKMIYDAELDLHQFIHEEKILVFMGCDS